MDRIGQGGMGSVYLARDPAIGRLVAIKLLKEEFDEDLRERFEREARSVGQLEHHNIVTIYDVGNHEGRPFIAMSYIPGETLAELIRRRAPLPLVRRLHIVEELCAGLHAAHKAGIVHRDVKPANVMVDPDGVVKILDFGIARLASESTQKTEDGTILGSYNYMSPEQLAGKPLNHRSDIFAVGAIFYEVLSYVRAFPGSLRDGLWYRLVHEPPQPLRELCEDLDEDVERIVTRALEKDAGQRYQDIDAMRRDVARVRRRLVTKEVDSLLAEAERFSREGDHEQALAKAQAALTLDPDDARAVDMAEQARGSVEHETALRAEQDRRAGEAVAAADRRMAGGDYEGTLTALTSFSPPHPLVASKIEALQPVVVRRRAALKRMDAARELLDRGDLDAAIAELQEIERVDPALPGLADRISNAQLRQRQREAADTARREIAQRMEEARRFLEIGKYKDAFKLIEAIPELPPDCADLQSEIDVLRGQVEDGYTAQVLELERLREISELLARARAAAPGAALPILRKILDVDPQHAEAKALVAAQSAALDAERIDSDRLNRIAEAKNRIEAHLARNEVAIAEGILRQAEHDFPEPDAFKTVRRRIEELRRLSGLPRADVGGAREIPDVDTENAPTIVIPRPRPRLRGKQRVRWLLVLIVVLVAALIVWALVIGSW